MTFRLWRCFYLIQINASHPECYILSKTIWIVTSYQESIMIVASCLDQSVSFHHIQIIALNPDFCFLSGPCASGWPILQLLLVLPVDGQIYSQY